MGAGGFDPFNTRRIMTFNDIHVLTEEKIFLHFSHFIIFISKITCSPQIIVLKSMKLTMTQKLMALD